MGKTRKGEVWLVRDPIFGDGGKARVVDALAEDERVLTVVRFQGGDNAGHTIVVNGKKIAVHAIPSGVVRDLERPVMSVMGRGMVINLPRVFKEIDALAELGIVVSPGNLLISEGAKLTLPYHMALERGREQSKEKKDTTARAISQTYAFDRMYQGIRAGDVRDLDYVARQIKLPLAYVNAILKEVYSQPAVTEDEVMAEITAFRERLLSYLGNEILALNDVLDIRGGIVLCEGAQSGMLDVDLGIYPNTTASNTWNGAIQAGCGLDPRRITRDVLVVKAYTSRVGIGHLVAECDEAMAEKIRTTGGEFGTTTGRPRRIGYSDSVIARYCALIGPGTEVAITKADILTGIDPLKICVAYKIDGKALPIFPATVGELNACEPVFEELPGWDQDITGLTKWDCLPQACRFYLQAVAAPYGCPISMVGTGPDRKQLIVIKR